MNLAELPLPAGVRRYFDCALETVAIGVRRFWRGDANATAAQTLTLLRQLHRLLRFAFILAAAWLPPMTMTPPRPSCAAARGKKRITLHKARIMLLPHWGIRYVDGRKRAQPAALARAVRDPVLIAQRKLDALRNALSNPLPLIRRIARRLGKVALVFGWWPPKRPPRVRDYHEETVEVFAEARYAVSEYWARMRAAA